MSDIYGDYELTIRCNEPALKNLVKMIRYFKRLGGVGCTRDFIIDGNAFMFDGDGPDRIHSLAVNGLDQHLIQQLSNVTSLDKCKADTPELEAKDATD